MLSNRSPVLHQIVLGALLLILLVFSFDRFLFNGSEISFLGPIYAWALFLFPIVGTAVIGGMFQKSFYIDRLSIIHLIIFLIPISYALSMITPASANYSSTSLFIQLCYTACFLVGLIICTKPQGARNLNSVLLTVSYVIIIFGLMNWFGDASLWGLMNWSETPGLVSTIFRDAVLNSGLDARLTSVFQYPNSYAALLIGIMVTMVLSMMNARKPVAVIIHSLFLVPAIVSFILTSSRGAFVILPVVWLTVLLFLKPPKQVVFILYFALGGIVSLVVLGPVFDTGIVLQEQFQSSEALRMWLTMSGSSILVAGTSLLIYKYLQTNVEKVFSKWSSVRSSNLHLPVASVIFGALMAFLLFGNTGFTNLLPDNMRTRVEAINLNQNSVLERGTFYQDAIKLWNDFPVLGAGGGAWMALYEKYQSNPYISRQAHNFYLQTLVETGIVGLLSFLFLLAVVAYHFIRSYGRKPEEDRIPYLGFSAIALGILAHSFLDFNMSFVLLGMIVFLALGGMLASNELPPFAFQKRLSQNKWLPVYPAVLVLASFILFIMSTLYLTGTKQYYAARNLAIEGKPVNEVFASLDAALGKQKHPEYIDLKLQLLTQLYSQTEDPGFKEEAWKLLTLGKQLEPNNKTFVYRELNLLTADGEYNRAIELIVAKLPNFPWEMLLYEQLADFYYAYGMQFTDDPQAAMEQFHKGLEIEDLVTEKAKILDSLPKEQNQGRAFGVTPDLSFSLGKIHYVLGNYTEAANYFQARVDTNWDDSKDFEAALYYLATLQKQSQDDAALLEGMLSHYPEPQQVMDQLAWLVDQEPIK